MTEDWAFIGTLPSADDFPQTLLDATLLLYADVASLTSDVAYVDKPSVSVAYDV